MDLKLGHYNKDGTEVVDVEGEIDVYTAPRLRELLIDLVNKNNYQLVVNMEKVEFLDSTGLGVLVGVAEASARPRRLGGPRLHTAADTEDLQDHRADEGLRHPRDGRSGYCGQEVREVTWARPSVEVTFTPAARARHAARLAARPVARRS